MYESCLWKDFEIGASTDLILVQHSGKLHLRYE